MEEMVAVVTEDHLFQVVELFLCLLDSRFVLLGDGGSQREFCDRDIDAAEYSFGSEIFVIPKGENSIY